MYSQRSILELVESIYGAIEDRRRWPVFLELLAGSLDCAATNFFVQDLRHPGGDAFATFGTDPLFVRSYAEHYGRTNIFLINGKNKLRTGHVCFSNELCNDREALRSEFLNDWVLPQGHEHGLLGTIFKGDFIVGNIGAIRARGATPFAREEKRILQSLMPHLQRAVTLIRRIAELEALQRTTTDALDRWTTAVFLVDVGARVVAANRSATELLQQHDGLSIERGTLTTTTANESTLLHRLIREGTTTEASNGISRGTMLLERPSGKRPLCVFVTPCARQGTFFGTAGHALIFVTDPENNQPHAEVLQSLYGLTRAETNVAALLSAGQSVKEIAEGTEVQENTIRMHLKRIFDKTGTKRQSELLKAILSSPATLHLRPH